MFLPRVVQDVLAAADELGEHLRPTAYELLSPATGAIQTSQFLNNAVPGPFVLCAMRFTCVNTPKIQMSRDGEKLVRGNEDDDTEVGVLSSASLLGNGDLLPAPIVIGQSLRIKSIRTAGGATVDKFNLYGFHVSSRLASVLRHAGEAAWCVLGMPSSGVPCAVPMDRMTRFDHLVTRDANVTASKISLRFEAHEVWPLGLTSTSLLPLKIDAGPNGDLGVTLAPGAKAVLSAINPSAKITLELQGRSAYAPGGVLP